MHQLANIPGETHHPVFNSPNLAATSREAEPRRSQAGIGFAGSVGSVLPIRRRITRPV
jgi:hypothetical protein